jgi:hypothetical protein
MLLADILIPLIGEDWKPVWLEHPTLGPDMDVAVVQLDALPDQLVVQPWETSNRPPAESGWPLLTAGQDVFILGYPYTLSTGPFPLWVRGTIASDPGFGYQIDDKSLPLFLVDARTRKGQSGSAVMRHRPAQTIFLMPDGTPKRTLGDQAELLGVYSGRTSDDSDLGFVWVMEYVDEICRDGVLGTGTL